MEKCELIHVARRRWQWLAPNQLVIRRAIMESLRVAVRQQQFFSSQSKQCGTNMRTEWETSAYHKITLLGTQMQTTKWSSPGSSLRRIERKAHEVQWHIQRVRSSFSVGSCRWSGILDSSCKRGWNRQLHRERQLATWEPEGYSASKKQ